MDQVIVAHNVSGPVLACSEGLSFWGGVPTPASSKMPTIPSTGLRWPETS